jgi:ectoine hydroxylase-related dioxygenase (phytanoyl-CoA dioxygenase family)
MPLESGPTQLLPFSHQYPHGYLSYRHDSFAAVFKDNFVQVPLKKGDALFFTPALVHAAGDNRSNDLRRSANLMQVSACWSRPMETVDRDKILRLVWSDMKALKERGGEWESLAKAVADGYSFPTNLDRDPPPNDGVSSLRGVRPADIQHCPPSQLDLVMQGLYDDWSGARLAVELDAYIERHKA